MAGFFPDNFDFDAYARRLFQIESGGNPNARTGSNRGLAQFGPSEEAQFGINDQNRTDPEAQKAALYREANLHAQVFNRQMGRPPTPGELYVMHQQGIAGGPALFKADPNSPAVDALRPYYAHPNTAISAISGNIPGNNSLSRLDPSRVTAGDFRNMWVNKFEQGGSPASTATASWAPPIPTPAPGVSMPAPGLGSLPADATASLPMGAAPTPDASLAGGLPGLGGLNLGGAASGLGKLASGLMGQDDTVKPAPMQPLPDPAMFARLRNVIAARQGLQQQPSLDQELQPFTGQGTS